MHKKVFRSFCNKLIDDKLIVSHTQKEETVPYKFFTRTYYYIHNIEAIDSIKWKIHTIVKHVKEEIGNFSEPQGYICPNCHHKYSLLDAASLLTDDKLNFECSICGTYLIDDDISQEQKRGQEKLEKLMSLVEPIIQYLKIVDDLKIDDNNFDTTLIKYVPAFSDSLALYSISTRTTARRGKKGADSNNSTSTNLSDVNKNSQATIHVSITADDEDLKRERQKREERNKKLRQNALPSWHQESTVGKAALGRLDLEEEEGEGEEANEAAAQTENDETATTTSITNATDNATLINSNHGVSVKSEFTNTPSINVKLEKPQTSGTDATLATTISSSSTNVKLEESNTIPQPSSKPIINPSSNVATFASSTATMKTPRNVSDATSAEELDALSAYYSQLRQRQAAEDEEEDEEEEAEEYDYDDEEQENGNDDVKMPDEIVEENTQAENDHDKKQEEQQKHDDSIIKEDIDEEDFDLDMFASDEE